MSPVPALAPLPPPWTPGVEADVAWATGAAARLHAVGQDVVNPAVGAVDPVQGANRLADVFAELVEEVATSRLPLVRAARLQAFCDLWYVRLRGLGGLHPQGRLRLSRLIQAEVGASPATSSPLLESALACGYAVRPSALAPLRAAWRRWAATVHSPEAAHEALDGLALGDTSARVLVARLGPAVLDAALAWRLATGGYHATRALLAREDLPGATRHGVVARAWNELLATDGAADAYAAFTLVHRAACRTDWRPDTLSASLVGALTDPAVSDRLRRRLVDVLGAWTEAEPDFWPSLLPGLVQLRAGLPVVLAAPSLPTAVAVALVRQTGAPEARAALSRQAHHVHASEVRALLLAEGQSADVWGALLATSRDPEEATRLLGLIAATTPRRLRPYLQPAALARLPAGTRLPVGFVQHTLAAAPSRADRLDALKALADTPLERTSPAVPPRARRTRSGA